MGSVKENLSTMRLDGESIDGRTLSDTEIPSNFEECGNDDNLEDMPDVDLPFETLVRASILQDKDLQKYWKRIKKLLGSDILTEAVKSTQTLMNAVEFNKIEIEKYRKNVEVLRKNVQDFEISDQAHRSKIEELKTEVDRYETEVSKKNETVKTLQDELKEQKVKAKKFNVKVNKLNEEVEKSKKTQRSQEMNILELSREKSLATDELSKANSTIERTTNTIKDLQGEIEHLKSAHDNKTMELRTEQEILEKKLVSKSQACEKSKDEIDCLRREISQKDQQLGNLNMKYEIEKVRSEQKEACKPSQPSHSLLSHPDLKYVQTENNGLKVKVVHYQKSILDLKESFGAKEEEYRQRIFLLESQLEKQDMLRNYEVLGEKLVHIQACLHEEEQLREQQQKQSKSLPRFSRTQNETSDTINQRISNNRMEIEQTLAELAESAKKREIMMREMKRGIKPSTINNKLVPRSRMNYNFYNQNTYSISISQSEKEAIVKRLRNTQEELKKVEAENRDLMMENTICKNESTKLASELRCYQNELGTLEGALNGKKILEKENRKLSERVKDYEMTMKNLSRELDESDQNKRKSIELECRLESSEQEKASLNKMITSLENDLEYHRKSSRMLAGGCCFELKVKKEQLENNVDQLQKKVESLENQISVLQGSLNMTNEAHHTQYSELQKLLERSKQENEALRRKVYDNLEEERSASIAPNVNVHVHLDQQTLQMKNTECLKKNSSFSAEVTKSEPAAVAPVTGSRKQKGDTGKMKSEIMVLIQEKHQLSKELEIAHKEIDELKRFRGDVKDDQDDTLHQKLDACLTKNTELTKAKCQMKKKLEEFESKKQNTEDEMIKMQILLEEKQSEWKVKQEEWKKSEEKQISELKELREQLQMLSNTDMESLRQKIQDLSNKKEKNESLIDRLKEEKCDLQMLINKLERELENTKQKLEFQETQRAQIRRNAMEDNPNPAPAPAAAQVAKQNKPTYPLWLESAANNAKDMQLPDDVNQQQQQHNQQQQQQQQMKSKPKPIWLTESPAATAVEDDVSVRKKDAIPRIPSWLDNSQKNGQEAKATQQRNQKGKPLTSSESENLSNGKVLTENGRRVDQASRRRQRQPLFTEDDLFGEDDDGPPSIQKKKLSSSPPQDARESVAKTRRRPTEDDLFGLDGPPIKNAQQKSTPQQPTKQQQSNNKQTIPPEPKPQQNIKDQKIQNKGSVSQQQQKAGYTANRGFLDDFAEYKPIGIVMPPVINRKQDQFQGEQFDFLRLDTPIVHTYNAPPPQPPIKVGPRDRSHLF